MPVEIIVVKNQVDENSLKIINLLPSKPLINYMQNISENLN